MTSKISFKKNISWIFIGNLLHSVLGFVLNIIVARVLTKNDYGMINYINSWILFFNSFSILGINNVINKFLNDNYRESNEYLCSSIFMRLISSIISMISVIILIFFLENGSKDIMIITIIYSTNMIFEIGQLYIYWFRYRREAKLVAILRLISCILAAIVKIIALIILKNVYIYTLGIVLETLIFSVLLFSEYKKRYIFKPILSKEKMKNVLKCSYPFITASVLSTIYAQTDKIMLKKMMNSEEVASYSVAITIAGIISTFATAIIEGYRPEILTSFNINKDIYKKRLRQLYCFLFWLGVSYGIFTLVFSKYIILILYGEKYLSTIPALATIIWYTSFSYFGSVNNMYLIAEGKEKYVQLITLIGAITNILLNFLLIPLMGTVGAALASLITQFFANFVILYLIKELRPIIPNIINGICFKDVIDIEEIKRRLKHDER